MKDGGIQKTYRPGTRLRIEYEGTVASFGAGRHATIVIGGEYLHVLDPTEIKVTLLDPPDWPPQVGDIWELTSGSLKGYEFFIRQNSAGKLLVTPQDGGSPWDLDMLKEYDPVLVRRRGQ